METVGSKKVTREGDESTRRWGRQSECTELLCEHRGGRRRRPLDAFTRSEKAELYSIAIAQAKAKSAALTRFPSGKKSPTGNERDDHHALAITLAAGPGSFVTIPGGFPVFSEGEIVGALGVSGAGSRTSRLRRPRPRC
jgi:Haem-degrading